MRCNGRDIARKIDGSASQLLELGVDYAHNVAMFENVFDHPSYTAPVLARQVVIRCVREWTRRTGVRDYEDTGSCSNPY